jgi:hypothetical protein
VQAVAGSNVRVCLGAVLLAGALLAGVTASVSAQVLYGSIVGHVRDDTGAALPGATITITNQETNLERVAVSNETGSYSFANPLPGTYTVEVSLQGFREHSQTGVPVVIGQVSRVDVALQLGALTETVLVESRAALLQTDKADVSTELNSEEIETLPLNQYRNYQALINLVPGATPPRFHNEETVTPARSLSINVNGQNRNNNGTTTDGATNLNVWLPHHVMYIAPAETIETVNVATNNFDAEQGMAGGATITVITKSGTNQFHGSAFEFHNNESLNASDYFFGDSPDGKPDKLPVERNIFGGTLGGPIVRNKLFFFGSFEGYRSSRSLTTSFSVPDAALRSGDFSQAVNTDGSLQIIYNPFTGNADGSGRQPFPGNMIPAEMLDPIAQQINGLYPSPNSDGIGAGGLTNNYQRDETRTTDRYNYDVKVNFNANSSAQIWAKWSHMDATVDDLTNYLGPDPNASGDGGVTKVTQWTGGSTWTLTPTMVWDATFGFSGQDQDVVGPDFQAGNFGLDVLGIPGTNGGVNYSGDPRYAGYPEFETGFSELGNRDGWTPIFNDERTYSFRTNLNKVIGQHDLRAGYTANYLWLEHWQPELSNPRGRLNFDPNDTALRGGAQTGNFYNAYASYLLGLVNSSARSIQFEIMTTREWQHGLYVRDRWAVNDTFTLDLGLRWEYYPIMHRADRGLERVDFDTMDVLLGGLGGNPEDVGLEASKDHFAPRLGAIYRLNEDTVFRAGYGVTYNSGPWGRPFRGFYPATIAASFFNNEPFGYVGTLAEGIPEIETPDISTGRIPLPPSVDMRSPEVGNVDRGTIQSWNVAVERRLAMNLSLDVAYVGTAGDGGFADIDANAPQVLGGGNESRPFFEKFGRAIQLRHWGSRTKTRYQSLQVALNRPFKDGLLLKGAYTLSKAENETDDDGWAGLSYNSPFALDRNFALAGYDRTHNFHLGFLYELPWRSEGGYDSVLHAIRQDWQLNGVFGAFSGTPFSVTANGAVLNTPGNMQTADLVGSVTHVGEIGGSGTYYDRTAWAQPEGVRFGTTGRNSVRGPGGVNLDLSLFRSFAMGGTRRLEFRAEAFNITNTPKFWNPNGNVNSGSFMVVTRTHNAYPQRTIRLGLRFEF